MILFFFRVGHAKKGNPAVFRWGRKQSQQFFCCWHSVEVGHHFGNANLLFPCVKDRVCFLLCNRLTWCQLQLGHCCHVCAIYVSESNSGKMASKTVLHSLTRTLDQFHLICPQSKKANLGIASVMWANGCAQGVHAPPCHTAEHRRQL